MSSSPTGSESTLGAMPTDSSPKTPDDLLKPENRQLVRAAAALSASRRLAQRDLVFPVKPGDWWGVKWFSGEEAALRARAALDQFPEVKPQTAYSLASQWVGQDHPLPPFEKIYPPQAEPDQPPPA